MKNAHRGAPLILILTIVAALAGCASGPAVDSGTAVPDGSTRVYEVFGMDCPGCHSGLENLLTAIPGITSAKAEWERKIVTVHVSGDPEVSDDAIAAAIRKANFTPGQRQQ